MTEKDLSPLAEVTPQVPPASADEGQALARDKSGKFVKGVKTGGRKKGSKNRITRERQALEAALREYMNKKPNRAKIQMAIDRLIDMAIESNDEKVAIAAIKVLTDKVLAQAKQVDDQGSQEAPKVQIEITNFTQEKDVTPRVIIDQVTHEETE
jgi:hypothetical protein